MPVEDSNLQVPADLADAGNHVRTVSAELANELNALKAQLAPLEGTWKGGTYARFKELEMAWNVSAAGLWGDGGGGGTLPYIAQVLDTAYANYMEAENTNLGMW
jgi:type VII secretion system (Wss) protein ESAT-6